VSGTEEQLGELVSDIEVAAVQGASGTSNRDIKSDQKDINQFLNRKRT